MGEGGRRRKRGGRKKEEEGGGVPYTCDLTISVLLLINDIVFICLLIS